MMDNELLESQQDKELLLNHLYMSLFYFSKHLVSRSGLSKEDEKFISNNRLLYEYIKEQKI